MSRAGGSAEQWAKQLRAGARRGVWRKVASWLGVTAHTRAADAKAANCEAGVVGEKRTALLLAELEAVGWRVFHDRRIPGLDRANADHVVVSPGAEVFLVDSKMLHGQAVVHGSGGRLWHGTECKDQMLQSLLVQAELIGRAIRTPVRPLMVVHNAAVDRDGFRLREVPIIPADRLVTVLAWMDKPRNPGARWLADTVEAALPRYRS